MPFEQLEGFRNYTINIMKKIVILSLIVLFNQYNPVFSQESINFSGGNANNASGSVAFSIGEVVFNSFSNTNYNITHGVQHGIEVFLVETSDIIGTFSAKVFPNPSSEQIQIQLPSNLKELYVCKLVDVNGKELINHLTNESSVIFDISSFEASTYYLIISTDNQAIQTFKIIKN